MRRDHSGTHPEQIVISFLVERPDAISKAEAAREITEQALEDLKRQLEAGDSAQLTAYLAAMGRFHKYSFGNLMLILTQRPDAIHVAGFQTWRSLGRSVKKGEKGIAIFAPMKVKLEKTDEENETEERGPPQVPFRIVHVFDYAQTEGDPLPEPARVGGDPGEVLKRLEAAVRADGIILETRTDLGGAEGFSAGGLIVLKEGHSPAVRFSVLVHEWAHERLHRVVEERPDKTIRETEAEAVAFVVCQSIGLETSTAAADYIRLYRGNVETLAASLDRIQKTACAIIEAISGEVQGATKRSDPVTTRVANGARQR